MNSKKPIHVLMLDRRWAVVRNGARVPLSVHDRKQDAVEEAHRIVAQEGSDLVVFDIGGRRSPPTYGP